MGDARQAAGRSQRWTFGLIDMLYTCMAAKYQTEVENSQARIAEALYGRQG